MQLLNKQVKIGMFESASLDYKDGKLADVAIFNTDNDIIFSGTITDAVRVFEALEVIFEEEQQ